MNEEKDLLALVGRRVFMMMTVKWIIIFAITRAARRAAEKL